MTRLKTQAAKESLLRRVRRQRLKYITVLPSLVTILNGVCGFAAIVFASKGVSAGINHFSYHRITLPYFAMSGYMILLAMIADVLDGRLARMSKNTSSFGGQLDSLCDIISFGVAPAFLMLKVLEYKLGSFAVYNPGFVNFLQRFIWLVAASYISCATIRLARFNVENEEDESAHMSFIGLPTPAAAGVVVSIVLFHQETLLELSAGNSMAYAICEDAILYALPLLVLGVAALMVSRIRYPHILNQYIKGKKPFAHFIRALLFLGLIIWSRQAALVLIFCSFAASGFLKWFYCRVIRRKSYSALSAEPPAMMAASRGPKSAGDGSD
ncbi:MAG: CDP-alcohol phosphatidyltransferase family protein [Phycisphaerae bacterium]|nr:CDP-alcohol phosphatidyltransferase family protein [Phycisphaerae bacterium]MDD5380480.1 CDP-alcohol phosphatidyltransferase family protein [Phycisphaerae bacterium]